MSQLIGQGRTMALPASAGRVILAPPDCTQTVGLRRLLAESLARIADGGSILIIDLSSVNRMNARLLATILLVAREARRAGGQLRLEGVTDEFRKWARTFRLLGALERGGVVPAIDPPGA